MRSRRLTAKAAALAVVFAAGSISGGSALANASAAGRSSPNGAQLPGVVSATPVSYTPNVFAGSTCGAACNPSTVYSTVVVGSEVVVAGAFTQACTPAAVSYAQCPNNVTADYIFAFDPSTGAIDPNFAPVLDQGPVYALAAGPNDTVYAGGAFTTVNGVSQEGLTQLFVTPGQPTDGQAVPGFDAQMGGGFVRNLALNGNALYAAGKFKTADGVKQVGLARLNATNGALDTTFKFTLGTPTAGATLQIQAMSLTPDGTKLAVGGSFQTINGQPVPRLGLINTGGGFGATATLDNWAAPILANACAKQHNYVNGIDFSPDGSFFVVVTTGFHTAGGAALCDSASRFETGATGTSVQPTWINYSGADSFDSVAVTGSVAYVGGHERWLDNECGQNHICEANGVLVDGIGAIDTQTGLALPWWQPGTRRGNGVASLTPYPAGVFPGSNGGLLLGTDVNIIGGASHSELAMFPLSSAAAQTPGGSIPSGMFSQGRLGGTPGSTTGVAAMCVDDAGDSSAAGTAVQLATCTNGPSQNWTVAAGGALEINGQCLDTAGEATTAGTTTVIAACNGSATQIWTPAAGNSLVNQGSGLCLDDPGASTTNDTQLQVSPCNGRTEQTWPLPVAQAPPPPPATGPVYSDLLQKDEQVPCMTNKGGKLKAGNPVEIDGCLEQPSQEWTLETNGTFQTGGLCLDTVGGATLKGTLLDVNTCDGAATQIWTPGANGDVVNQGANKCLTDPTSNTASGTQLIISPCTASKSQDWLLPNL